MWNICHIQVTTSLHTTIDARELTLQAIAFEVERYMLREKEGAMYDKISLPIRIVSRDFSFHEDVSFLNLGSKTVTRKGRREWKGLKEQFQGAFAPIDKLKDLVCLLQLASQHQYFEVLPESDEVEDKDEGEMTKENAVAGDDDCDYDEEDDEDDGWKRYSSSDDSTTIHEEIAVEGDAIAVSTHNQCDADTLLEQFTILLLEDLYPHIRQTKRKKKKKPSEQQQPLSDRYLSILQRKRKRMDWLGECLYLSSPIISQDLMDMNGMEGYALVTFQQVIQSILIHNQATISPAGRTLEKAQKAITGGETNNNNESKDDELLWQQPIDLLSVHSFERLWASVQHVP